MNLDGVFSQRIDQSGKLRVLNFNFEETQLSLMTDPLPPLDLQEDDEIYAPTVDTAVKFIADKKIRIVGQHGINGNIQGIWVQWEPHVYNGYIPVQKGPSLKDVPFTEVTDYDPVRVEDQSLLTEMRDKRKLAEFLKKYALYTYALSPDTFGEDSFVIKKDYVYDIERLNKKLFDNDMMYERKKLVVPSEDVRKRLISYVNVQVLNDRPGVMNLLKDTTIDEYYLSNSDFKYMEGQALFLSKASLLRWVKDEENKAKRRKVYSTPQNFTEPYFYLNNKISPTALLLVQNVENGDKNRALSVCKNWADNRSNLGYSANIFKDVERHPFIVYDVNGKVVEEVKGKEPFKLLKIDNRYSALLFI